MIIVCVWIISSPCQQRSLFLGLLQYQEKEAASSEDKCSYSITSYNTKRLEQTSIIIDYKERVSQASFVIGQLYTSYAHFLSKRPFSEYSERKPYTEWACTKKVKCFFFCLQPQLKYGFQDYSATEDRQHAKYKHTYEQVFLCTTETTDPSKLIINN